MMFPALAAERTTGRVKWILTVLGLAGVSAAAILVLLKYRGESLAHRDLPTATVRRADVDAVVLASGRVASARSTEIRCTLEKLDLAAHGGTATQAPAQAQPQKEGASAIVSLVSEGATVKQGEVICELDASEYQELARRQQIVVEEAKAEHTRAALELEVAKLALRSYREGEKGQVVREYEGEIALAKSDLSRQSDRLAWSKRMLGKGYVSVAQVASDQQKEMELIEKLHEMELTLANFQRYTSPKEALTLESENQIAYFLGRVELTTKPPGLRPRMTAEVSILSDKHRGVLTIPSIAVKEEEGGEYCYVDRSDRLERRPVKVIRATHELIEVVEGLTEGERVVLDPYPVNSEVLR
jgi:multidrug efflux pump subunit AcrA (membrane-fusion protein)